MITIPSHIGTVASTAPNQQTNMVSLPAGLDGLGRTDVTDAAKAPLLRNYIEKLILKNEKARITTDVSIIDMQTGRTLVGHNLQTEQFAASVNKVPVALLIVRDLRAGKLTLSTNLTWSESDVRAGAGVYDQPGAPTTATVQQLLVDLLKPSGNTAVRVLVNQGMGGATQVNTRIRSELGLQHTYLQPLDANRFYVGNSTAYDASIALRQLLATQDTFGAVVKDALVHNIYTNYGVRSQLAGNDYIVLANKVGILDDTDGNNRHDVGLIYNTKTHKTFAYALMNTAPGEAYEYPTALAGASLADMGKGILGYAGDKAKAASRALDATQPVAEKKVLY